jgi:outer membrane receptor protein involved in Fe transport
MRVFLFFFLVCLGIDDLKAQDKGSMPLIKGEVADPSGTNLEFATVSLFQLSDSTLIGGALTDAKGMFEVQGKPVPMYAVVEFLGYITRILNIAAPVAGVKEINTGRIRLEPDAVALDAVEIVAEKSETVFALDRKIFNVGKDLTNKGGTAQDVLDNVPSVTVDADGAVSLRGSGNVRILIDGKPSGLIGTGASGLRSIPSNMIDRIEVITNPSARYEAEGMSGIINIVLKKDQRGGLNGSFEVSGGWPENYGIGSNINYRKGKTNFFVNYGMNYNENPSEGYLYQENTHSDTIDALYIVRDGLRVRLANSIRTGMDFSLTDKQTLTGSLLYRYADSDNSTPIRYYSHAFYGMESRGRQLVPALDYTLRLEDEKESSPTLEYNLDYINRLNNEGHEWKASVQYSSNAETESASYDQSLYINDAFEGFSLMQRSLNDEDQENLVMQTDYVRPFGKDSRLEAGLRSQLRRIANDYLVEENINEVWQQLAAFSNQFRYNEEVHAAYATYGAKIKKLSYQGGLRFEYSGIRTELLGTGESNPRDYTNLFPSGHLNYEFPGQNQVQLSYSRRIQRPRFWDLNPFFTFADNRNIFSGNPNLNPEFTNSYEIGHIKYWEKGNIGTNIFWRSTSDVIQRVTQFRNDGTTLSLPLNLATSVNAGIEWLFAYTPSSWLKLDGNLNVFRNVIEGSYQGEDLSADSYSWFGRIGSRFNFWKNADFQLRFNYRAPVDIPQGRQLEQYIIDIAFSKDFLQNNATFTIAARDLLNSRRRNTEIYSDNYYQRVDQQWRRAPITATFSYRLNMKKEKKKTGRGEGDYEGEF